MARRPRVEFAGAIHHVWARGNDRRVIFRDDRDRRVYLSLLGRVIRWKRWHCLAYCLMDNHVHLLVETPWPNLASGVQSLHGRYGRAFNDRHGCSGHVFQGRYGSSLIRTEPQLWHTASYVVRNPVDAGLCRHPRDWPWSSFATTLGPGAPDWLDVDGLLRRLATAGGDPRRRFEELVLGA